MSVFDRYRAATSTALAIAAMLAGYGGARAADMPGYYEPPSRPVAPAPFSPYAARFRWDGFIVGGTVGYLNLNSNFDNSAEMLGGKSSTSGHEFGGFIGYNWDWDGLILGAEAAYNRPSDLTGGSTSGLSTITLTDKATARIRAGYAVGQFLPYGFVGAAVGRMDYSVPGASQSDVFAYGATAGLGIDVSVLPNVFLRAEWEYNYFAPVHDIGTSTNTGRVGVGLRF